MKNRFMMVVAAFLLMQGLGLATPSFAQTAPAPTATPTNTATGDKQCTEFQERKDEIFGGTTTNPDGTVTQAPDGLLSDIYYYIKDIVNDSTERLYNSFIDNNAYQSAVFGAMTLMILIFGVGFVIGVIQPSFGQVLTRLIKLGIIMALVSPGGWEFFSHNMVAFFNDGTDDLVKGVTAIGTGSTPPAGATPFYQFDRLAAFLIQPDTIIAIMGSTLAGGPYGMTMGGLMVFAVYGFVKLLIDALRIYSVSYVARSLLLGLAPVFFVFLLFDKTKQLFMTWLNALISLSLQPILLFTFLSFFMVLMESATKDMLNTEFCWTEYQSQEGTTNKRAFWRPVDQKSGEPIVAEMTWRGTFDCVVSGESTCPEFPMNIVDILTFLVLVYLAQRFAGIIERIANELANTYIALDAGGRFAQFMSTPGGKQGMQSIGGNPSRTQTRQPPPPPPQQQPQNPQQGTGRTTPGGGQ